jgi:molecular chaperone HtpG
MDAQAQPTQYTFQAEIKQLLDILVHSLYTEREIFLRELISNASDALNRVQFELLTNREARSADAPLEIRITADEAAGTLTISDTGVGMTRDEMIDNLGVIARSGAKAFIQAMKGGDAGANGHAQNVIGQFGVGFYSAFMVADKVRVISRSYAPEVETAYVWESDGGEQYSIAPAERAERGTDIILHLKDEDKEFLRPWKLKEIIRKHSDYIGFPIYIGDEAEPSNKQTAIWRSAAGEVTDDQYDDFYKMLTLDFDAPLHRIVMRADVPIQFYALLYIPSKRDLGMFSPRREPGLKLYARKVLIQDFCKDLLPEYLGFVQGVVDTEDLPLNVNRESVGATRIMATLKKTLTGKVLGELKKLARNDRDAYLPLYHEFGRYLKQGLAISPADRQDLEALLFFPSTRADTDADGDLVTLDDYIGRLAENQTDIYYIVGDDFTSTRRSPHLDAFRQRGIEVLYFTDPIDPIMLSALDSYKDHKFRGVDEADLDLSGVGQVREDDAPAHEPLAEADFAALRDRFAAVLGERVSAVRESKSLVGSPARLVSDDGAAGRQMFRINRLLDRDAEMPVKILELNPRHPLLHNLQAMLAGDNPLIDVVVEQVFETALLQDGLHPDPAAMAERIITLMQAATGGAGDGK